MDLNDHLKKLEQFSRGLSASYDGAAGRRGPWSGDDAGPAPWYARAQRAVEFLTRSGAAPEVAEIKDGPQGSAQGLRLRSFDADGLKAHLASLGSARAIAAWIEEGVAAGAISVRGERIFFAVEPGHDRGASGGGSAGERGVEATGPILEAAHGAMEAETAGTLQQLEGATASGGGEVVQFRDDLPARGRKVVTAEDGGAGPLDALRGSPGRARTLASADEMGAQPRFVVTGAAVTLADGTYYPVEAVDAVSRRALRRAGATGVKVGQSGRRTLVRADHTQTVFNPQRQEAPEAAVDGPASADRRDRIQLAYRLLHGITLDASQGQPLDAGVASRMERFFGESLGDVRVHTGRVASEITEALSVEALSIDRHVVIPENLMRSASGEGERVLVHELAHVSQARRGSDEPRSVREMEADTVVNRFVSGKGQPLVNMAKMPTRSSAPPPESAGTMPTSVYAAAPGQVQRSADGGKERGGTLSSEKSLRRITAEVSRRNRRSLEDLIDRQG